MIIVKLIGGLGNQMFQYAAAYMLAKRSGQELYVDNLYYRDHSKRHHRFTYRPYALSLLNISAEMATPLQISRFTVPRIFNKYIYAGLRKILPSRNIWHESDLAQYIEYQQNISENWGGCYLEGFFQNYKFIKPILSDLKTEFSFKDEIQKECLDLVKEIDDNDSVCIVFRRGDYVGHPVLDVVDLNFYYKALEFFPNSYHLYVFSDGLEWCKANFKPANHHNVTFVDDKYTGEMGGNYLQIMMHCKHFIIPNSTYPYWAALLSDSPSKKVVVPKIWYKGQPEGTTNDIWPDNWIAI